MIRIFTDGSCEKNPGRGGWAALLINGKKRTTIGGSEACTTNNRMELTAVIEALKNVPTDEPVEVLTDSQYVMHGASRWLKGWKQRNWTTSIGTPVENQDLWRELDHLMGTRVHWVWVRGHAGNPDNEHVNAVAMAYAFGKTGSNTLKGPTPPAASPPRIPSQSGARLMFPLYLSLVQGELRHHASWPECEQRVKGVSNARFKKCHTPLELNDTLRGWGLDPAVIKFES